MISKLLADAADLKLVDVAKVLTPTQDAYFAAKIGVDPEGRDILRHRYTRTVPTSVQVDGEAVIYECHEYEGAQGKGYILHAWVMVAGVQYHRQRDFGPEGRSHRWQEAR